MVNPQLHQHLSSEVTHIVNEMIAAHCSWADIVATLQGLVLQALWHTQGFLVWWLS